MLSITGGVWKSIYPIGRFILDIFLIKTHPLDSVRKAVKGLRTVFQIRKYIFSNLVVIIKHVALAYMIVGPIKFTQVCEFQIMPAYFFYLCFFIWIKQCFAQTIFWC